MSKITKTLLSVGKGKGNEELCSTTTVYKDLTKLQGQIYLLRVNYYGYTHIKIKIRIEIYRCFLTRGTINIRISYNYLITVFQ